MTEERHEAAQDPGDRERGSPDAGQPRRSGHDAASRAFSSGRSWLTRWALIPGDQVTFISPTETEGPLESVPRLKRYVIEGIYHSGMAEQELHTVFATEGAVRSFLRRQDAVTQWEISVKDFEKAPEVAREVQRLAPQFKSLDWIQLNSHLFASLRLERVSMFIILAFIIVVASFNIVTTLTLMVLEKKREISILKAMGARHGQVAAIFLAEGILIGGVGVGRGDPARAPDLLDPAALRVHSAAGHLL